MIIYCGQCGKKLLPDDSAAGKVGVCAGCRAKIPIPKAETKKTPICIFCPECNAKLAAPINQAGKEITCPKCDTAVQLHTVDKSKLGITSKVIDSGLIDLEDVEELRKIPLPPPPSGKGPSTSAPAPEGEERAAVRAAGSLLPKIAALVILLIVCFQLFREITLNLKVADASHMTAQKRYRDATQLLDRVILSGPLTVAKWRAATMRPEYDKLARAQEVFQAAEEFAAENPDDYRGAARLFGEAASEFRGTSFANQAGSKVKAIELKAELKARPLMKDMGKRVADLIGNGKYAEAKDLPDQFPQVLLTPKWEAETARFRRDIDAKIEAAKGLLAKGAVWQDGRWVSSERKEQIARARFEKEQLAKGLIKVNGEWITKEEKEQRERERIAGARRAKGMFELYKGKWLNASEVDRMSRRVFIESKLPGGSGSGLASAIEQAGMIPTAAEDRAECGYILRASHVMDARPDLRTPDAGTVKVTVTVTVCKQEIENPGAPKDKLVIKEEKLFTIAEAGRKMTSLKGAVKAHSGAKAVLMMEVAAVANAVGFIESQLATRLRELTNAGKTDKPVADEKAKSVASRLRRTSKDHMRRKYAEELVAIGRGAVPALLELLEDKSPEVRLLAVKALGKIGDPSALRVLRRIDEKARRKEEGQEIGEAAREAAKKIYQENK